MSSYEKIADKIITGEDIWVVLSYLQLKHAGYDVSVGANPISGKINVIDGVGSGSKDFSTKYFYLACRNDAHYPEFGHYVLHQNLIKTGKKNELYCPQWPQPCLIPRELSRGKNIKTIAFFGQPKRNLAKEFQDERFINDLAERNIDFIINGKNNQKVEWHDYSKVDLVIAVRDIPEEFLKLKPLNKVTNAWLAGALCITGEEPAVKKAFPKVGAVLQAKNKMDVLEIIDLLSNSPDLYADYLAEAKEAANEYVEEVIIERWIEIEKQITPSLTLWNKKAGIFKNIDWCRRAMLHRISKRNHKKNILSRLS